MRSSRRLAWLVALAGVLLVAAVLLAAGSFTDRTGGGDDGVRAAAGTDAASESEPPGRVVQVAPGQTYRVLPLADLAPAAATYLATRDPQWGVTALLPGRGAVYSINGREPFAMASVTKVVIMLAVLDSAVRDGRDLTPDEHSQLEVMIVNSDNAAAVALWDELGGNEAVASFLRRVGVTGIIPAGPGLSWGDSTATSDGLAQLLAKLWDGTIADSTSRDLALRLMSGVAEDQRWGASVAFPGAAAMKDGWYPAATGWRVTSVAMNPGGDGEPLILVALTRNQPSFEYGVETIQGVARRIGTAVFGGDPDSDTESDSAADGQPLPDTEVFTFEPPADGLPAKPGTCDGPSAVAVRAGAWSCTADDATYDPCFRALDGMSVVCNARPGVMEAAFRVEPHGDLPAGRRRPGAYPWLLALEDGTTCERTLGEQVNDDGDRLTYVCDGGSVLIGPVQRTGVWSALKADAALEGTTTVRIVLAWY